MLSSSAVRALTVAAVMWSLAACAATAPYVYIKDEFDRTRPGFGSAPEDITEVMVCYNSLRSGQELIRQIADSECRRFGKLARPRRFDFLTCPLAVPTLAEFDCVAP